MKLALLLPLLAAVFVGALDQTAIVAVLPAIVRDLAIPFDRLDEAAWVVSVYLIGYAAVVPLAGRLIDVGARSSIHVLALLVFAGGSAACALAGGLPDLIGARLLQALGAGALLPLAFTAAGGIAQERARLVAIGLVAAVAEAGAVLGPFFGAVVLALLDWRWVFWLNLPLILPILAWQARAWRRRPAEKRARLSPGDALSPILLGSLLGVAIVGLSREAGRLDPVLPAAAFGVGLVLGGVLVWWERRTSSPAFPRDLIGKRRFWATLTAHAFFGVALMTPLVLVPAWASTLLQRDATDSALVLLRMTLAVPPAALVGGFIAPWMGGRAVGLLGFAVAAAGLWLMGGWSGGTSVPEMTPALALAGVGFGLLLAPITEAALLAAPAGREASAVSLATGARVVGMAAGLSAMTSWGLDRFGQLMSRLPLPVAQPGDLPADFAARVAAYQTAAVEAGVEVFGTLFQVGAACALVGAAAAVAAIPMARKGNHRSLETTSG